MTWWVAGAVAGSAILGAVTSNKASKTQANSANQATDLQRQMWEEQQAQQKPFHEGGVSANNRMLELLGIGGDAGASDYGWANKPFGMSDFTADPGYGFRLEEGIKGLDKVAAARGGLISGGALKAGARYAGDLASSEYTNAFNRYQVNRANRLNPLQSMLGVGQSSANTLGSQGGAFAVNAGNNTMQAGNARASGYMGGANAVAGGVGQYVNYMNNMNAMNTARGGNPSAGYGGGYAGGTFGSGASGIPEGFGGMPGGDVWYG